MRNYDEGNLFAKLLNIINSKVLTLADGLMEEVVEIVAILTEL